MLEIKKSVKPIFDNSGFVTNKDKMIDREKENLTSIVSHYAEDKMGIASPIIDSVAFMTVSLVELQKILLIKGFVEEYKNGENQYGLKESSESKVYVNLSKTCLSYRKQLLDIIGKVEKKEEADELMAFISGR